MDTKALRQKILDLAIRGKLVPQDPNDEPASVLLERIRAEKQQMVKDGRLKAKDIKNDTVIFLGDDNLHYEKFADGTVKCIEDEIPFELPEGWEWTRINNIAFFQGGYAYKSNRYVAFSNNLIIRIGNVKNKTLLIDVAPVFIDDQYAEETANYKLQECDILFTMTGTKGKRDYFYSCIIEKSDIIKKSLFLNQRVGCLRIIEPDTVNPYLFLSFIQSTFVLDSIFSTETGNVNQGNIGSTATLNLLIPIPPIEEQKRVINCISTVNKFIDTIESDKTDLQTTIQLTKSKILDLAIRGKLVPQDPNDEPASVLLERIRAEKEELIKQGKIKRDKKESVIFKGDDNSYYEKIGDTVTCIDEELPFELPDGWAWIRLQTCCQKEIKRGKSPKYAESSDTLVFAQKCNTKYDGINMELALYLDESTLVKYPNDEYMQDKDTVINSTGTGTLGRVGIYRKTDNRRGKPVVPDSHVTVIRANNEISAEYLYFFLKAYQQELEKLGEGSTNQKELKPLTLKNTIAALTHYAEQARTIEIITAAFEIMSNIEKSLS